MVPYTYQRSSFIGTGEIFLFILKIIFATKKKLSEGQNIEGKNPCFKSCTQHSSLLYDIKIVLYITPAMKIPKPGY